MCGIAGFIGPANSDSNENLREIAGAMGQAIAHRGPDDLGLWADSRRGVALAHRRLSIIDLSIEGHQPMYSPSGRYIAVLNGEIYNYPELRRALEQGAGVSHWRGHSDTEVLLAACDAWGVDQAIRRANGMFALAIVDLLDNELVLVRDRMGEKPLYYGWRRQQFLFGSELKALRAHPQFTAILSPQAIPLYLRFGYVPAPYSIYSGIYKLPAGATLRLALSGAPGSERLASYWRVPLPGSAAAAADGAIDTQAAVEDLHNLLRDSVRIRMQSDVPLGAFLSGGIDSSTVVALMQAQATRPVHTFSIGFKEGAYDETPYARRVAQVLGTRHEELFVTAADALAVLQEMPQLYDEPFADSSGVPTLLLSRLTRKQVTVALSGDGGDELFGGYVRYVQGARLLQIYRWVPATLRLLGAKIVRALSAANWDRSLARAPRGIQTAFSGDRLRKLAAVLPLRDARDLYRTLTAQWPKPEELTSFGPSAPTPADDRTTEQEIACPVSWMMYVDQLTYLPDDILVKVDRASMSVALETRVPFLDHRLVEFAARLPRGLKLKRGRGKWILRQVSSRYLDQSLFERPKQGFALPLGEWLRGPLRDWAEDLLSTKELQDIGLVHPAPVRSLWNAHLAGRGNHQHALWVILMLQSWYREAAPEIA